MEYRITKNAVIKTDSNQYGMKYTQEIVLYGNKRTPMRVRLVWVHDNSNGEFRLVTAMMGKTKI